jgi:hypothetical protein
MATAVSRRSNMEWLGMVCGKARTHTDGRLRVFDFRARDVVGRRKKAEFSAIGEL